MGTNQKIRSRKPSFCAAVDKGWILRVLDLDTNGGYIYRFKSAVRQCPFASPVECVSSWTANIQHSITAIST